MTVLTKSDKRKIGGIVAKIERHKLAIGKHRDALRTIFEDLESVVDASDDAVENLGYAVDRLSEYT